MKEIADDCIPKGKVTGTQSPCKRTNENLPMLRSLWIKIKRKQILWRRLVELRRNAGVGHEREYTEVDTQYRRLNNQIR